MKHQYTLTACNYSYIQLIDFNARFYSPTLGRFIQPDNIIPNPANSQSWNRYSYSYNNPLNYIDPSGHVATGATDDEICLPGSYCDPVGVVLTQAGQNAKEVFEQYRKQTNGWWFGDGDFTFTEFVEMMFLYELQWEGEGLNPLKDAWVKQLWGDAQAYFPNDRTLSPPPCQGVCTFNAVFNWLGQYVQAVRDRYKNVVAAGGTFNEAVVDLPLIELFNSSGNSEANSILYPMNSAKTYSYNSPYHWGNYPGWAKAMQLIRTQIGPGPTQIHYMSQDGGFIIFSLEQIKYFLFYDALNGTNFFGPNAFCLNQDPTETCWP